MPCCTPRSRALEAFLEAPPAELARRWRPRARVEDVARRAGSSNGAIRLHLRRTDDAFPDAERRDPDPSALRNA